MRALFSRFPAAGGLAVVLVLLAPAVHAQDTTQRAPSPGADSTVAEARLQAAARVIVEMQTLRDRYQKKYGNPQDMDSTESQAVRRKFKAEQQRILTETVSDAPTTADEYRQILQRTRRDTTLRRRMRRLVLEVRKRQVQEDRQEP